MDCGRSGSSVHGILQARTLEWVAISFSRGSSRPRDRARGSCIAGRRFTLWPTRENIDQDKIRIPRANKGTPWQGSNGDESKRSSMVEWKHGLWSIINLNWKYSTTASRLWALSEFPYHYLKNYKTLYRQCSLNNHLEPGTILSSLCGLTHSFLMSVPSSPGPPRTYLWSNEVGFIDLWQWWRPYIRENCEAPQPVGVRKD